jgi:hypothetical protein
MLHFLRAATLPAIGGDPLGIGFDRDIWSLRPPVLPDSPRVAGLVELAQTEFRERRFGGAAAVGRLARSLAPDEPEPQRIVSLASAWLPAPNWGELLQGDRGVALSIEVHCALGDAYRLLGDPTAAISEYEAALSLDGTLVRAHLGISSARLPGVSYDKWLTRLHELLRPAVYLEIGVETGDVLALARPPTIAIGVDPVPSLTVPVVTETHVFAETSDEFFAQRRLNAVVGDRPVALSFIDGLHHFEVAIRDFINVEAASTAGSVILLHDTLPLDDATQRRDRETQFWTGDIWKVVVCLRKYRPDLEIFTIATFPSGLTVVCNLDPASSVLSEGFDRIVEQYMDAPFSMIADSMQSDLCIVPNEWDVVVARLRTRGLLRRSGAT